MSEDIQTQRRWLIAALIILTALLIGVIVLLMRSIQNRGEGAQVGHRSPAAELAYCAPEDTGLCIVSFGQVVDGDMLVNFQIPRPNFQRFNLTINRYGVESTYECKKVKGIATAVTCMGPSQVPGEVLQFKVISRRQGNLIAEGKFAIIGIAISTPEGVPTETVEAPAPTEPPAATEAPTFPSEDITPTVPSYPNPTAYP